MPELVSENITFLIFLITRSSPAIDYGKFILIRYRSEKTSRFRTFTTLNEFSQVLSRYLGFTIEDTPALSVYPGITSVFDFPTGSIVPGRFRIYSLRLSTEYSPFLCPGFSGSLSMYSSAFIKAFGGAYIDTPLFLISR